MTESLQQSEQILLMKSDADSRKINSKESVNLVHPTLSSNRWVMADSE